MNGAEHWHGLPRGNANPIQRVSIGDLREGSFGEKPLIVTGGMQSWPALTKWPDPNYFRTNFGEKVVQGARANRGAIQYTPSEWLNLPVNEFLDAMFASEKPSLLMSLPAIQLEGMRPGAPFHRLLSDIDIPPFFAATGGVYLLLGNGRTVSNTHTDARDNLIAMASGIKRFVLFDPNANVYPHPVALRTRERYGTFLSALHSSVNLEKPDLEASPGMRTQPYYEAEVVAGEMIYMPVWWWHFVSSEGFAVAANFWRYPPQTLTSPIPRGYFTKAQFRAAACQVLEEGSRFFGRSR